MANLLLALIVFFIGYLAGHRKGWYDGQIAKKMDEGGELE